MVPGMGMAEDAGMTVIEAGEADCQFVFPNEDELWLGVASGVLSRRRSTLWARQS